jgi:hypothetical protein
VEGGDVETTDQKQTMMTMTSINRLRLLVIPIFFLSFLTIKRSHVFVSSFRNDRDEALESVTIVDSSRELATPAKSTGEAAVDAEATLEHIASTRRRVGLSEEGRVSGIDPIVSRRRVEPSAKNESSYSATDEKPWLVIHVGPPKTATTTIQEALTTDTFQQALQRDNYVYTGAYIRNDGQFQRPKKINQQLKDVRCHMEMSKARQQLSRKNKRQNSPKKAVKEVVSRVPCAKEIVRLLQIFKKRNQSLIISDETLSNAWTAFYDMRNKAPLDFISLRELLSDDWNLLVIIGYRRFVDWLPSAKQQIERWNPHKPRMNKWPDGTRTGGKAVSGVFPDYWKRPRGLAYHYTHEVLAAVDNILPVRIFNMHLTDADDDQLVPVRTNFLCHALPNAPHTCAFSKQMDAATLQEKIANPQQTLSYDMLATAAAAANLIDTVAIKRHDAVLAAQEYHEKVLNQTATDFPVTCPDKSEYETYLNHSLILEKEILPELFATTPALEERHIADFWKSVAQQKYCHIDTAAVLQESQWVTFFWNLRPTTSEGTRLSKALASEHLASVG